MLTKQIQIPRFGSPDVLACTEVAPGIPARDQSRIQIHYAGVNPIDAKTRAGLGWAAEQNRDKLPWVPGYDIAGKTLDDHIFPEGTPVCGMVGFPLAGGGYSQQRIVNSDELCRVPDGVSLQQAAGVPLAGLTASQGLFEHGKLQSDEKVVILGANGGVGHLAVQLAASKGASVIAVAARKHWPWLTELGADSTIEITELPQQAASADLLLDLVGGETAEQALSLVHAGGRVVTVPTITADDVIAAAEQKSLKACRMLVAPEPEKLQAMLALCTDGRLKVQVERVFPMTAVTEAHQWLEQRGNRGKALLNMDPD